jgi:O-antigen/teichoic acid export membrane protein
MASDELVQIQVRSELLSIFWRRVLRAGGWAILAYGGNQVFRFLGNLLLTRLLFPEAFGLMALVQIVLFGVNMFSDFGIGPAIVQSAHGRDRRFLNTAWSLQVLRGLCVWVVVCAISYPVAMFYEQPQLVYLISVVGFVSVIDGFVPTAIHLANRDLNIKLVSLIDLSSYLLGLIIMVVAAWVTGSVWSLVVGGLISSVVRCFLVYWLCGGGDRFSVDRDNLKLIFGFSGWIFISSIFTFVAIEGARLFIGRVLDIEYLAFYTIAYSLCIMYTQLAGQVFGRVFFPAIAEINRVDPGEMNRVVFKLRAVVVLPSVVLGYVLSLYGAELVAFLYDARYLEAGRILEIISLGVIASGLSASFSGLLLAVGKARFATINTAIQAVVQMSCLSVSYSFFGVDGLFYGLVASSWLAYLLQSVVVRRGGFSLLRFDFFVVLASFPIFYFMVLCK